MIDLRLSARQKLENILADDQVFRGLSLAAKQNILQHAQFSRHHAHQQILQQHQCIRALLHKPICKGFFSDIIFK